MTTHDHDDGTARIPTFAPCQHQWVSKTLQWCPDCDLVRAVESDVWAAGWASGWAEALFRLQQHLKQSGSSSYVVSTVSKAAHAIAQDTMGAE